MEINFWIFLVGVFAGLVDAAAGSGGILMVSALLMAGLPPVAAIATNKLCGTLSAVTSVISYLGKSLILWRPAIVMALGAVGGAVVGARVVTGLPPNVVRLVAIGLLIGVLILLFYVPALKRRLAGIVGDKGTPNSPKTTLLVLASGGFIGLYDGAFGPGAGILILIVLMTIVGANDAQSAASGRVVNAVSSGSALIFYYFKGYVNLDVGISAAAGMVIGSLVGSHIVMRIKAGWLRPVLLIMTFCIVIKMAVDYWRNIS